jgi:hypothetical protein
MVKKWYDDGSCGKNCITFEQCIKYLYNTSLPAGEELKKLRRSKKRRS